MRRIVLCLLLCSSTCLLAAEAPATPKVERNEQGVITLSTATEGAMIRYTIDGSDAGPKSGPYLAPIALPSGGVIKARAFTADRKSGSELLEVKVDPQPNAPKLPSTLVPCTQDRDFPIYDWAVRHTTVKKRTQERQPELVFIGDSITQMFGGEPHDRSQPGTAIWDKYYGHRKVGNLGYGYDYLENTLWRLQHGELDGAKAKAVVVHIGTNNAHKNSVDEIVAGIHAILKEIRRRQPQATIVLMGIFPRGPKPDATREKLAAINKQLATLDGKDNVRFLDITTKFLQPDGTITREIMGDYLHPSAAGYQIWAEAIEPVLTEILGDKPVK
ncbi:MAG: GDSL-type esterase/lipase family protein [Planctomycetaceae bacterium]|nr:GDSL-type esterase/lipase family protein [Planctomycetaceae bacterium]